MNYKLIAPNAEINCNEEVIRGLNICVSLVLSKLQDNDVPEIVSNVEKAAKFLFKLQRNSPIESSNLTLDFFIDEPIQ